MAAAADPLTALCRAAGRRRARASDWRRFVETVAELSAIAELAGRSRTALGSGIEPHLDRIHDDAETRRADLMQLEQIASGYPSRERFLTELTLDPPDATSDQAGVPLLDEDYLILSTIHSAKGQEWKQVFVLNVVDGCIPSDLGAGTSAEIEEERRLLYVAMTRAKDDLASSRAAALLHPRPERAGRPPCLCRADALHSVGPAPAVRTDRLADRQRSPRPQPQARDRALMSARACATGGDRREA